MESTTLFRWPGTTRWRASSDTRFVMPGGNATLGQLQSNTLSEHLQLRRSRARGIEADAATDGDCRHRLGNHHAEGRQYGLQRIRVAGCPDVRSPAISADRQFQNTAPELALLYKLNPEWQFRAPCRHRLRHAAGRKPLHPLERPERQQHAAQDAEEPRLRPRVRLDAEQRAQIQRDRLLRVLQERTGRRRPTPVNAHRMRASRSTRRDRNIVASSWPPTGNSIPGWRFTAAYTYLDQFYTEYTENIVSGGTSSASTAPATRFPASRRTN